MDIKQYNDNVTKGRYELDSFQIRRFFPKASRFLVDYVFDRSYVNAGDERVKRIYAEYDAVTYYRAVLSAAAKVRGEDKFNAEDGAALVKLKLHDKAANFICNFSNKLWDECRLMKERVAHFPMTVVGDDLIDPAVPKKCESLVDYSITGGYSYAKLRIFDDSGVGGGLRGMCYNIADRACEALRNHGNIGPEAIRLIDRFKIDFASDIALAFAAKSKYIGGGNWSIEKKYGEVLMITVTAHTKRSPDDENNPATAAKELVKRLNRSLNRLERIIRMVACDVLDRYLTVGHVSKAIASTRNLRRRCIDKGLATPESFPLVAVNELEHMKR